MVFITDNISHIQWLLSDCHGNKIGKLRQRVPTRFQFTILNVSVGRQLQKFLVTVRENCCIGLGFVEIYFINYLFLNLLLAIRHFYFLRGWNGYYRGFSIILNFIQYHLLFKLGFVIWMLHKIVKVHSWGITDFQTYIVIPRVW